MIQVTEKYTYYVPDFLTSLCYQIFYETGKSKQLRKPVGLEEYFLRPLKLTVNIKNFSKKIIYYIQYTTYYTFGKITLSKTFIKCYVQTITFFDMTENSQ